MAGYGAHIQGSAQLTTSSTATIFGPGGSGTRWTMQKGLLAVYIGTGNALIDLMETDSTGSDTATFFTISGSAPVVLPVDLGEHGYTAASANSRLALQVSGSEAGVHCMFVGYQR